MKLVQLSPAGLFAAYVVLHGYDFYIGTFHTNNELQDLLDGWRTL